jgi:hypothetical protein
MKQTPSCHILSLSEPSAAYPTELNSPVTRQLKKMRIRKQQFLLKIPAW